VPGTVLAQARRHLERLEQQQRADGPQMGLFDAAGEAEIDFDEPDEPDALRERLDEIDPDALSPREALALLYELKKL
jgi:DNA mismatch repair protein MutS